MKKIILSVLLTFSPLVASAGPYDGLDSWAVTSDTTTRTVSGGFAVAASTKTWRNFVTRIDGTRGITSSLQITASSITATSSLGLSAPRLLLAPGVALSSAPALQYGGLYVSSNVYVPSGGFYYGNGSNLSGITLDQINDPLASKTFTLANKTLAWQFTNPAGGMLWNFTGAATGHSLEIAQSGGNPGADMHLLHIEATDPDPTLLHLRSAAAASEAFMVDVAGDSADRFSLKASGLMEWGPGNAGVDTNLYRSAANTLKTDDSFYATGSITSASGFSGALTGNASTASALAANPGDCSLPNVALGIDANGTAVCSQPSDVTGNSATATKLATARAINGVSFDGSANINIATTSYLADGVSLALTGETFSAKSSSVTLQGNTFNGASQLVKLDALSKLPAVDGSQLTNLPSTAGGAVLASTQTFTGGNALQGSTTFYGTVNLPTRDKIAFGNELANSSSTFLASYSTTQTTFATCVTGSTLTITTNGGRVMIGFAGSTYSSGQNMLFASYMRDGVAFGKALSGGFNTSSLPNWPFNSGFVVLTDVLSAGAHTFCLMLKTTGATMTLYVDPSNTAQFWVQELR